MDALNHADQMRLANLINDNSDDAEIQKKLDQVVELTSSTRDQAAVALHDCHYDVEKAVDMILENGHAIVETQWKSAGKRKNKNNTSSQAKLSAQAQSGSHHQQNPSGSGKNQYHGSNSNKQSTNNHATSNSGPSSGSGPHSGAMGRGSHHATTQHHQKWTEHQHTSNKNTNQQASTNATPSNQFSNINNHNNNNINSKQDASDGLKNIVDSSNLIYTSDSTSTTATTNQNPNKTSSLPQQQPQQPQQQQQQQPQQQQQTQQTQQQIQRSVVHQITNRQQQQQQQIHPRSTRIPDSAVEMPSELQVSSLNVQFGELDLREGTGDANDAKGAFQDVLESNRLERQSGIPNSHSAVSSHDGKGNRHISQQQIGRGGPRRQYNHNNNNDDRRFYNNPNRGGRQISGNQRPHNQRLGPMNNNNPRGVRTIMSRGPQPNSSLSSNNSNQATAGFPNSIDTWTNSTAEAASKTPNVTDQINAAGTLRVGQWSDVTGNEDWSEEDWEAKVMETKVFTPSTKPVDGPPSMQKNQPLLTDTTVASQINLASNLPETVRDDLSAQQNTLNAISPQGQSQQTSQKSISHMNNIFDASVAKVLEQQNFSAIKPKTSIGIGQYPKDPSDAKNVLDQQNLSSIKPKTSISINQYNKEASESLKSLVGISTSKGGVPSVPPGALPLMSQPQYIMGNAYQPAIFPYAYQTPDVHYQVAAQNAGRDQNFQSVYPPNDASKFNRGADGDAPSITTTQSAPVASQTPNQAFVTNALHAGYPLTYAMPGAFNMMPQNLYSAAPIFPHMPQPTNTGSANNVYQKNTAASYQHHTGYSGYDHPLIQDYVKQQQHQNYSSTAGMQQQQQQPTSKSSGLNSELDVASGANSYNMYGSTVNKNQPQANKQTANYNDNTKGYQQQISGNGPQQQFGFSQHNMQHQSGSIAGYPLLQSHGLDGSGLNNQGNSQQMQQHNSSQRGGTQVNPSKYYPNWN